MNYSFEYVSEQIHHPKTKEYFKEVLQTYQSGNYRSCIVILYSIVITDLLYKLEELKDLYSDDTATKILEEVESEKETNKQLSAWEMKLVEEIYKRTKLLEASDYANISSLKDHRNLSAHPVLNKNFDLFNPSLENARSHIRNMLDGVLTKPSMLSKKVFTFFIEDIAGLSSTEFTQSELERFLESRYFRKIAMNEYKELLKSLWRITFSDTSEKSKKHRYTCLTVLNLMIKRNKTEIIEFIRANSTYFSKLNTDINIEFINETLCLYPQIFTCLSADTQEYIRAEIRKSKDDEFIAYYLNSDLRTHMRTFQNIFEEDPLTLEDLSTWSLKKIYDYAEGDKFLESTVLDWMIKKFHYCGSYNSADVNYENLIVPHFSDFSAQQMKDLLKAINRNSQIRDRRAYSSTIETIKLHAKKVLGEEYDFSEFQNIRF
ncbi:hypothetical protein HPY31_01400 [Brevibacillus sp. HB1.3]|uniref:hypothetical protein n=1 Tax=Brevibacillus sp. HB1.3 TaxID=2738842 RepID=UPI001553272A|nr:hypothetical protein [Brevibacillus sp. HB1.3]NQF12573.1 hypothetical protein [Brevibacillus sp. HB1.3]